MSSFPLERVGSRDPQRCQKSNGNVACNYKAVPGAHYCPMHGGSATALAKDKGELRNLILQGAVGQRAKEMQAGGKLKDLTDEVILCRVILEGLANNIKTPTDFMIYGDKVTSTARTIQSLVESLQKVQEKNKELVDRATLFMIAEGILSVITQFVSDPDQQREAGELIYALIVKGLGGEV